MKNFMKKIYLALFLRLLLNNFVGAQALLQIGQPLTPDLGYDLLFLSDGSFLTCGSKGNNAVLYKTSCAGNIVAQIEKPYAPGPGRFYDAVQLPGGGIVSVGSVVIATPADTFERVLILQTNADLAETAVVHFLIQNKPARAKSVTLASNGDLLVLGEVSGFSTDFIDMFLLRVNANTLQPIGGPVVYSNGVDLAEEIIRTADNHLLLAGSSFSGNIFDPNAMIVNRLLAIKTDENGAVLWQYAYQDSFPAQYGLALAAGIEQNPVSGNFMFCGTTYGGTPDLHEDAIYMLIGNDGALLDTALLQTPVRQRLYGMTDYSEFPGLYISVGDSDNPVLGTPNLFFTQALEAGGIIAQVTLANDPASPYSISDVIEIGQNRLAYLATIPDNFATLDSKDIVVATPQVDNIDILYQNCALAASFNAPNPVYQWYLNDLPIPGANSGVYFPAQTGIYRVQITDTIGCFGFSDTLTVTLVSADFTFNSDNLTIDCINNSSGAAAYTWDFGDGSPLVVGQANPTHTYADGGVYTITLIAGSACGADTVTQTVGLVASGEPSGLRKCSLFPNPNQGKFSVDITGVAQPELTVALFDQVGKQVGQQVLDFRTGSIQSELDFGAVLPGAYSLQIQARGETRYLKVLVTQ